MTSLFTRRRALAAAGAAAAGFAAGAAGLPCILRRRRPENLFLIVADAMRADVIGKIVNGREVTPNLNTLASRSLVFTNAFSAAPGTKFSVASIFSGLYPPGHGVENPRYTLPECTTLAGYFSAKGCRTLGVVTNPFLAPEIGPESSRRPMGFGFNASFDAYRPAGAAETERQKGVPQERQWLDAFPDGALANRVFWSLLDRRVDVRRERVFAYLHYMDSHQPWLTPWPVTDITGAFHRGGPLPAEEVHEGDAALVREVLFGSLRRRMVRGEALARLEAIYLEACALADAHIGQLFDGLRLRGLFDDATIIFTADHGEEFMEHGCIGHAQNLFNTSLAVPLVIKRRYLPPGTVGARVSNAAILPTAMEWHGDKLASTNVESLVPWMEDRGRPDMQVFASFVGRDKVIMPDGREAMSEKGEMISFDVNADPREEHPQPAGESTLDALAKSRYHSRRLAREANVTPAYSTYAWQNPDAPEQNRLAAAAIARGEMTPLEAARAKALGVFGPHKSPAELAGESGIDAETLSEEEANRLRALGYLN